MNDGFYRIENVFTQQQREKLIKDSQPLFLDGSKYASHITVNENVNYGFGYQEGFNWFEVTFSSIQYHPDFYVPHKIILAKIKEATGIDYKIQKSWMNISNGDRDYKKRNSWHNHEEVDLVAVYYVKIPFPFFSNGTLFKDYGLVKAKENSILCFPSHLDHSTPPSPLRFKRHSWSMNLVESK